MEKHQIIILLLALLLGCKPTSKDLEINSATKNAKVILITLDGYRWQELFTGADSLLISNKEYVHNVEALKKEFWRNTPEERRQVLMPFIWNKVAKMGQIYGNRNLGNNFNLSNGLHFSYPGYNEILTGKADDEHINSNAKMLNPNVNILEIANNSEKYKNRVAAFGSWDVFPYILNYKRSKIPVNAGFMEATDDNITEREDLLNNLQKDIPSHWNTVRLDVFTHHYAMEYLKRKNVDLLYIAYGETDDFAHDGEYDKYLQSAHLLDHLIQDIWNYIQQNTDYKDNTTVIITTDHGRGYKPIDSWKHHSNEIKGCDETWLIAFGKGVSSKGEISKNEQFYTNQIAASIAQLLGIKAPEQAGKPINFK